MRKLSIASLGESQTVPVTVALCLAPLASLVAASSDDLCCFGVDEGLEHELHPPLSRMTSMSPPALVASSTWVTSERARATRVPHLTSCE